jgi:hypothetical protein
MLSSHRQNSSADLLGVRYLLVGSICHAAGRIRITAELIDAIADHRIWSERYDQDSIGSFVLQDEICDRVVKSVRSSISLSDYALSASVADFLGDQVDQPFLVDLVKIGSQIGV